MNGESFREFEILVEKIKEFKETNSLTFEKIGNALGVNKSHIYRVMNMEVFPSFQFLIQLAHYMEVPLGSLFTESDEIGYPLEVQKDQQFQAIKEILASMGLNDAETSEVVEHICSLQK